MSRFCWLRIFNPARIQIFSSYSKYSPKISQIFPIPSSLHPQKRTTQRQRQRGNVEPWGVDFTLRGGYGWSIQFLCGCIIQHRDEERGTKKKNDFLEDGNGGWEMACNIKIGGLRHVSLPGNGRFMSPSTWKKSDPSCSFEVLLGWPWILPGWWLTHPSEKWWSSSVGMMIFPIWWEK